MNKKTVWNMKLKGKDPRGRPRSRWEQVDTEVREKEGRKNMAENWGEELQEDRDRWRGLVPR
jgi:hypothetical protein